MYVLKKAQQLYLEKKTNLAYQTLCKINDLETIESIEFKTFAVLILSDLSKHKQALAYIKQCVDFFNDVHENDLSLYFQLKETIALFALGYCKQAKHKLIQLSNLQQNNHTNQEILFYSSIFNNEDLSKNHLEILDKQLKENSLSVWKHFIDISKLVNQVKHNQINQLPEQPNNALPFYRCIHSALKVLLNSDEKEAFLQDLAQQEGIVFYRNIIQKAISFLIDSNSLTDIESEFILRWQQNYLTNWEAETESHLTVCDFKACESRCCYDGAYLEDGEEEMIREVVMKHPNEFSHLPSDFIVDGNWNNLAGRKTNTRPHNYKSPDYPSHFNQTRCVFADNEGACSLQLFAINRNETPWKYKPKACLFHPLQVSEKDCYSPPTSLEEDVYNINLNYPGYVSYTPCGVNRADGKHWQEALKQEIKVFNQ